MHKRNKIFKLKCFNEVLQMIKKNDQLTDIATFIQNDRQELTRMTKSGIISAIRRFKEKYMELAFTNYYNETNKRLILIEEIVCKLHELILN